ncbi:aminotransferase class I/II-fold pyridoxal phosphate-dependent enzyme [Bacillus sp. AK128]
MLEKMICDYKSSLLEALLVINNNAKGIAFIVNEQKQLLGVVTDGDIRRLLLKGNNLETKLTDVIGTEFIFASQQESYEEMMSKLNSKIKVIPIVNENNQIVDFFEYRNEINIPVSFPDLTGNELKYLTDAFLSTWISSSGKYINAFEESFASFCNVSYGIAVSNGTVALHLALKALGIKEGDEVIVPDLTFAATINAILHAGATPVIVDIEVNSWCIDPIEIEKAITPRTKAIIPVHLYGQPCDMDSIMKIATKYGIFVVEDCAEAHGALYKGKKVGSFGNIGCFSFFANKVITTGEGGMCVTNCSELSEKLRLLRDHGMSKDRKYWHEEVGYNYRMTNLQASLGVAQLERIDAIIGKREKIEKMYRETMKNLELVEFQNCLPDRKKITWLVSALIFGDKRDFILEKLKQEGFDSRPFFYPLSHMDIYKQYTYSNKNSQIISRQGINFPTYIHLKEQDIIRLKKILDKLQVTK